MYRKIVSLYIRKALSVNGACKIMKKTAIIGFALFLISASTALSIDNTEPLSQPLLPMVRAMGNAYTAVSNDENAVFYNPAGYGTIEDSIITAFALGFKLNIDNSAIDVYRGLLKGTNITSSGNITDFFTNTTIALGFLGPIYLGRVGNKFGFAFYNHTDVLLDTNPGATFPFAQLMSYSDLGFNGGYGTELPFVDNLYVGLNFKVILRLKSQLDGTVLAVFDTISDDALPLAKSVGFGADVGIIYRPIPWLSFGLTGRDVWGTRFSSWENVSGSENYPRSMIKPRLPFGIALFPLRMGENTENGDRLVIALDYADLLDYSPFLSNVKFGVKFSTLKILDLRGGFDGGYLTGGIRFNLKVFHIDTVYFVDELGSFPGAKPAQNIVFNFGLQW